MAPPRGGGGLRVACAPPCAPHACDHTAAGRECATSACAAGTLADRARLVERPLGEARGWGWPAVWPAVPDVAATPLAGIRWWPGARAKKKQGLCKHKRSTEHSQHRHAAAPASSRALSIIWLASPSWVVRTSTAAPATAAPATAAPSQHHHHTGAAVATGRLRTHARACTQVPPRAACRACRAPPPQTRHPAGAPLTCGPCGSASQPTQCTHTCAARARAPTRMAPTPPASTHARWLLAHFSRPQRGVIILPGLGNNQADYTALSAQLEARGYAVETVPIARIDWSRNAAALTDPNWWRGTLQPRPAVDWYLQKLDASMQVRVEVPCARAPRLALGHATLWQHRLACLPAHATSPRPPVPCAHLQALKRRIDGAPVSMLTHSVSAPGMRGPPNASLLLLLPSAAQHLRPSAQCACTLAAGGGLVGPSVLAELWARGAEACAAQ